MAHDSLAQLIRLQHNAAELSDEHHLTFSTQLIHHLHREELQSLLFYGLNAMRLRGRKAGNTSRRILSIANSLASNLKTPTRQRLSCNDVRKQKARLTSCRASRLSIPRKAHR